MKINSYQGFRVPMPEKAGSQALEKDFGDFLKDKIKEVDQLQKEALGNLQAFATGQKEDLVDLTLSLTQAELSFKLLMRVRNKVLEAYQEIMRMQI